MLVIGEADVDGIDRWILKEPVIGGMDDVGLECGRSISTAACYGMEPRPLSGVNCRCHGPCGDPARAEESPPDRHRLPQELRHDGQSVVESRCLGGLHEGDHVAGLGREDAHGHPVYQELNDRRVEGVGRNVVERQSLG